MRSRPSLICASSVIRSSAWACICSSKNCQRDRPASLARNRAASDSRSRLSEVESAFDRASPIDAVGRIRWSWTTISSAMALSTRSATRSNCRGSVISVTRTTNSSPPKRPAWSRGRTTACRRCATVFRISSPAACPKESLTILKLSRSRNSTPTREPLRLASRSSTSNRSSSEGRLRSPVSASWKAWCCRASRASCSPVMSLSWTSRPRGSSDARRMARPACTQHCDPSPRSSAPSRTIW